MKGVTSMGWREGYCKKLSGVLLHGTRGVGSTHWVPRCIVKVVYYCMVRGFYFRPKLPLGKRPAQCTTLFLSLAFTHFLMRFLRWKMEK